MKNKNNINDIMDSSNLKNNPLTLQPITVYPHMSDDDIFKIDFESIPICSICLNHVMNDIKILPCGHCFHNNTCIGVWLETNNTCPVCRADI